MIRYCSQSLSEPAIENKIVIRRWVLGHYHARLHLPLFSLLVIHLYGKRGVQRKVSV